MKVRQTLLGHKTATLTLDRDGHLFPSDLDRLRTLSIPLRKLLRTPCGRFRHYGRSRRFEHLADLTFYRAPSRTRTDTGRILSPLPLPIGLWGPGGESSARTSGPWHRIALKTAKSARCVASALRARMRAPRVFPLVCRPDSDDTAMSPGRSLLKLPASALRSRKRLSP